jgi:hypothetical protein
MWTVEVKQRDAKGKIRWYTLRSSDRRAYLKDGFTMGSYRYKRDAIARAKELSR